MTSLSLSQPEATRSLPSIRQLAEATWRQRLVFLTVAVLVAVGLVMAGLWTPMYEARMKVMVERRRIDGPVTTQVNNPLSYQGDQVSEEDINSEIELLNSQDLLRQVVIEAGLNAPVAGWRGRMPEDRRTAVAVYELSRNLKIDAIRKSNFISLRYDSPNPSLAHKVLLILSKAYVDKHMDVHRPHEESEFYEQESQRYKTGFADAQTRLIQFDSDHRIAAPAVERDLDLQRESEFDASSRQAAQAIHEQEARLTAYRHRLAETPKRIVSTASTAPENSLLQQERLMLLNLRLKRTELLTKYAPTYAPVQEVEKQIASVETSIQDAESDAVVTENTDRNPAYEWLTQEISKTETELNAMKVRANLAADSAGHYRDAAQTLDAASLQQEELTREAKLQADNYTLYVQKREQARMQDALDRRGIVNVMITEPPTVPMFPLRTPTNAALMTMLIAFTLGAPLAIGADQLRPHFHDAKELAMYLGVPVLATLPRRV